jgi:hypothetical protein
VKCSDVLDGLVDYLDNTMTVRAREEVDCHRAWCHNCHTVLDTCQTVIEIYRTNECLEVPNDFPGELRTRLHNFLVAQRESVNEP